MRTHLSELPQQDASVPKIYFKKRHNYGADGVPHMSSSAPCSVSVTRLFTSDAVEITLAGRPAVNRHERCSETSDVTCEANY